MIGSRIKALRESKGYNMRQMASALNLPYTTYVNYEKGAREPNSEQLILISKYFGVSVDYLLGLVNEPDEVDWSAEDLQVSREVAELLDYDPDKIRAFKQAQEQDAMNEPFAEELPEEIIILNRAAKKMTPENRKKLLELAKVMFEEDFDD